MRNLRRISVFTEIGLPDCKPVSVPSRVAVIHLGRASLPGSSDLPGSKTERTAPPPLFGLAPRGVCTARRIAPSAVRSYRTFSPLPPKRRYIFCCTFREKRFERVSPAVSRHAVLWRPDFPLPVSGATTHPASQSLLWHIFISTAFPFEHNDFCCSFLQFGSILLIVCRDRPRLSRWVPSSSFSYIFSWRIRCSIDRSHP